MKVDKELKEIALKGNEITFKGEKEFKNSR